MTITWTADAFSSCAPEKKRWPNGKGINKRDMDLHTGFVPRGTGVHSLSAPSEDSQLLPCPGSFLVVTVGNPDPFLHICMVLGENCKKLTGASPLGCGCPVPTPTPAGMKRK